MCTVKRKMKRGGSIWWLTVCATILNLGRVPIVICTNSILAKKSKNFFPVFLFLPPRPFLRSFFLFFLPPSNVSNRSSKGLRDSRRRPLKRDYFVITCARHSTFIRQFDECDEHIRRLLATNYINILHLDD